MYFLFEHGSATEGEAAGGLGDMIGSFAFLVDAKDFATANCKYGWMTVVILDGATGLIYSLDDGQWTMCAK